MSRPRDRTPRADRSADGWPPPSWSPATTLQLVEELIERPLGDDGERFEWIAGHTTLHAVSIAIGLAAMPLLIASVLLLARFAGRMHGLARAGASVCVVPPPPSGW